ncbi:hypothetical protein ASO20_00210 [Mycoplasma sp. (ex Biomphalaria glabrata)]|uniref:hypothetical protein n=1 Tax=Mycoplasma sp. (ex Biomphalaria glabrata) TaxID=1749074 RepID=UPI00073ABD21|nr:hypothetical protein [Mycoplasma sp. (ex Biomphalaria glabrata)]ALV23104.1 hypothetical protein ASO20_00210 [Mycoplasma sp. (ex Biomphalaria glabrata)]
MNKKFKLLTLLATLTTVTLVPISKFMNWNTNEQQISKNHSQQTQTTSQTFNSTTQWTDYASKSIKEFNANESPFLSQFEFFLKNELYFVDLTSVYENQATPSEKDAIEKISLWIGKSSDYTFSPMTNEQLVAAATANFPDSVNLDELDTAIKDFVSIQSIAAKTLIDSTYSKWIQTMEGTEDGHQWGWYNQDNLSNMFPAFVIDSKNGLTFDNKDDNIANPGLGLQNLLARFHDSLEAGNPERLTEPYLNPVSGSAIETTFHEYQTWGKNQFSYYVQKIINQYNSFYYGFDDQNSQNQQYWNYYLEDGFLNPLTSVDQVISKWINVMKDPSWNASTAINFLFSTDVWADLSVDSVGGKDATIEQYEFVATADFNNYTLINTNSFELATNTIYNQFLENNYFGYADPNGSFNVSQYFSGTPLQIVTIQEFKNSFKHKMETFFKLTKYFIWIPDGSYYKPIENQKFLNYVSYQQSSLEQDFQSIIDLVSPSYYGYATLVNNRLTTYIFQSLELGKQMSAADLAKYFILNHPLPSDEYLGVWATKSMIDSLKSNPELGLNDWVNDQKTQLNNDLQKIIDQIKDNYFGWVTTTSGFGLFVSNVDKLLVNFPVNTELSPEAIAATITMESLPTGLTGLNEINGFLKSISLDDINTFKNNESEYLRQEISRIVSFVANYEYYGYSASPEFGANAIYQTILYTHTVGTPLNEQTVVDAFKQGLTVSAEGFPKPYLVRQFLGNITVQSTDFQAFIHDQRKQVIDHFTTIIGMIEPYYYGFERLANNPVSDFVLLGYTDGTPLDPVVLANYLMDNFPKPSTFLPGEWYLYDLLTTLITDKTAINVFLTDQSNSLQNAWNPIYDEMVNNYYGYTTKTDSLVSRTLLIIQNIGTPLDSVALLKSFKQNVIDMHGTQDFPFSYGVKVWLETLVNENKISGEFGDEQRTALSYNIEQAVREYNNAYWGYNNDTTLPNYFIEYFLDSDHKTPLTNAQIESNILDAAKGWGFYKIYDFFNSGISGGVFYDLSTFSESQEVNTKDDLSEIFKLLVQFYYDKNFDYTQTPSPFKGANHIWTFFNTKNGSTIGLPTDVDSMYNLFKAQVAQTDLINETTHYSVVAKYLKSLYHVNILGILTVSGELRNWKKWEAQ